MILTMRPALLSDAEGIAVRLRPEDKREVETATGLPAAEVVPLSFQLSVEAYAMRLTNQQGKIEDDPTALFGVCGDPHEPERGVLWMVASSEIVRAPISFLREARHWLDHFSRLYPAGLHALADSRNGLHLRWLRLLSFQEIGTVSVRGHEFVHVFKG